MKYNIYNIPSMVFFVFLLFTILCSCKKKDETPEQVKQWLLTINFKDDFINPKLGAIVFISDLNGNPLADTMIAGNSRLVMHTDKTITPPFQVTLVKWEPDMHNFLVTMNTYLNVVPSEWTVIGQRLVSTGDAVVNLLNLPDYSGPILFSNSGYSNLTFTTSGNIHPVYKSPDDLYIRLNTGSGPVFTWKNGIVAGGVYDVDLTSMTAASTHAISFPVKAQDFKVIISGYQDTSVVNSLQIVTDEQIGNGSYADSVIVCYPPSVFSSFHSQIEMIESWTSTSTYFYSKFGVIPDQFVKTDAAITDIQVNSSSVTFKSSGNFTVTAAKWSFQDIDNLAFDWTVFGPDTLTTISLPSLPPSMTNMFPTLTPDSLRLHGFELIHYPSVNTYPDYLERVFNPEYYGRKEKYEAASVKIRVD